MGGKKWKTGSARWVKKLLIILQRVFASKIPWPLQSLHLPSLLVRWGAMFRGHGHWRAEIRTQVFIYFPLDFYLRLDFLDFQIWDRWNLDWYPLSGPQLLRSATAWLIHYISPWSPCASYLPRYQSPPWAPSVMWGCLIYPIPPSTVHRFAACPHLDQTDLQKVGFVVPKPWFRWPGFQVDSAACT